MYLTRLELDTSRRKTMKALAAPQLFHGAIVAAFAAPERYLWRMDRLGGKIYLLISSTDKPDLSAAAEQFGYGTWEIRSYDSLLDRLKTGEKWHFRLRANPVVSVKSETSLRGKVLAHVTVEQQKEWLMKRSEKHGFALNEEDFTVVQSEWLSFQKGNDNGRHVTIHAVTFEGLLTVTDNELLRKAMTEGIGRGKAYGLGMLTVADRVTE